MRTISFKTIILKGIIVLVLLAIAAVILKTVVVRRKYFVLLDSEDTVKTVQTSKGDLSHIDECLSMMVKEASGDSTHYCNTYTYQVEVDDVASILTLRLSMSYPEAFILRINDQVAFTSPNVFIDSVRKKQFLITPHLGSEVKESFFKPADYIKKGLNTVAIEVFSNTAFSNTEGPDFSLDIYKKGYFFKIPESYSSKNEAVVASHLPKLYITTNGQEIPDEPKVKAAMKLVYNEDTSEYNIKIETRGESSQHIMEYKSYTIDTYNEKWEKKKTALLGLPKDSKWVLYIPYSDKSMIRNALTYILSGKTGQYAPKGKFCDVYIDDDYKGVFLLVEKPMVAKNRVHFKNIKNKDVLFCEIDGKREKSVYWEAFHENGKSLFVNIKSPNKEKIDSAKIVYMKQYFSDVHNAINAPLKNYNTIDSLLDMQSMIDYILINELTKNMDAYRKSTYFSKIYGHDSTHTSLKMGPVWDYDLAYGNNASCVDDKMFTLGTFYTTEGWCHDVSSSHKWMQLNWSKMLFEDTVYFQKIADRWKVYRETFLCTDSVFALIDSLENEVVESQKYYYDFSNTIDRWVWPNGYVGGSFEHEIFFLKNWLARRMYWMDQTLLGIDLP